MGSPLKIFISKMKIYNILAIICLASIAKAKSCATEDGQACVFPFQYDGLSYSSCTAIDSDQLWCATEVDADGDYIDGQWGNCNSNCGTSCATEDGQACVFP